MPRECEKVLDYFNDLLTEKEKKEFESHLESCAECREEVEELRELTEDLPYSAEPVSPPEGMKDRVLGNVFAQTQETSNVLSLEKQLQDKEEEKLVSEPIRSSGERPKPWVVWGLSAALALSILGNLFSFVNSESEEVAEPDPPAYVGTDLVSEKVTLQGEQTDATATAAIILQGEQNLLTIQADQLSPLQGEEVYQVWLINEGTPYRAGNFVTNENGEGALVFALESLPQDVDWETVAISREPDATSEAPRGEVVLSSQL